MQLQTAGDVKAVVLQPDGKLIVAGDFDSVNGVRRKGIVRLNSNGSVDYTWNPSVTGSVFVMALNGTDLYIGGQFITAGGLSRNNLAKISTTGNGVADPLWDPSPHTDGTFDGNGRVVGLAVNGTNVYVGGYFYYVSGQFNYHPYLAKLDAKGVGAVDSAWSPAPIGGAARPQVYAIAVSGTNVFVGGGFTLMGGLSRNYIAKLDTQTGVVDASWNPGANNTVQAIVVSTNDVIASGVWCRDA